MRLNAVSWFILSIFLLILTSCEQIGGDTFQTVWKSESGNTSTYVSTPTVELVATPTLRSKLLIDVVKPEVSDSLPIEQEIANKGRSVLLNNGNGESDHLKGIGRLVGLNTCTASLIDNGEDPAAPAYVLTAGRCVQPRLANEVYLNSLVGDMHVIFNYFSDSKEEQVKVPAKMIAYSTLKGRDIAIVELEETINVLKEEGIVPFPLNNGPVVFNDTLPMFMIGAPAVGFPPEHSFLRMEECMMDGQVDLVESQLFTYDAYRTDCQDNYSGSAGSPLFADEEFAIIGVSSSTTVAGYHPCTLGGPCEIADQTTLMRENKSYATPVTGFSSCFNQQGQFDISLGNCPLADNRHLQLLNTLGEVVASQTTQDGETSLVRWNTTLSGDFTHYRYMNGSVGSTNCRNEDGYGEAYLLGEDAVIDEQIPEQEGIYVLCVMGGDSQVSNNQVLWQSPENSATVLVRVDNTPPDMDPIIAQLHDEEHYVIQFHLDPPELSDYEYKMGPQNEIVCQDTTDYILTPHEPLQIPKNQTQYKLCIIAIDTAGNKALPYEIIVGGNENAGR